MTFFSKHRKIIFTLLFVFVLAGGIFVLGTRMTPAQAASSDPGVLDFFHQPGKVVMYVLANIAFGVLKFFALFVSLAGALLEATFKLQGFVNIPVVQAGWAITRGLANMFFALILLIMAVATILQIESLSARKLLPRLIVAALLINFSLLFCGIIIDFSQVLTGYFLNAAIGNTASVTLSTKLANSLNLAQAYQNPSSWDAVAGVNFNDILNVGIGIVMGIIFIAIATFTLLAAAIFLLIRMAALWLLLIFSPLAWVSMIVSGGGGSAGQIWGKWWSNFLKYTFFAPIYAFFIYLAMLAVGSNSFTQAFSQAQAVNVSSSFLSGFFNGSITIVLQYVVVIIILLGGLFAAQQMGIQGAGAVMNAGKRANRSTRKFVNSKVGQWAAHGAEKTEPGAWNRFRRGTSYLVPSVWKKAWESRKVEKERESKTVAIGARQDTLNRILSIRKWGTKQTEQKERAERFRVSEERKNIYSKNEDELVHGYEGAKTAGNTTKMAAYLQALFEQNGQNGLTAYLNKKNNKDYKMDAKGITDLVNDELVPKMGQQASYRLGNDLVRIMEGNGQIIGRPFKADVKTGQFSTVDPHTAEAIAHSDWLKQDNQQQAIKFGRFTLITEGTKQDKDGNMVNIDEGLKEFGKEKLAAIAESQVGRTNVQTKEIAMYNHAVETKEINAGFYSKALEEIHSATKNKDDAALAAFIEQKLKTLPRLADKEKEEKSIDQLKADLGKLRANTKGASSSSSAGPTVINPTVGPSNIKFKN